MKLLWRVLVNFGKHSIDFHENNFSEGKFYNIVKNNTQNTLNLPFIRFTIKKLSMHTVNSDVKSQGNFVEGGREIDISTHPKNR